MRDYEYRNMNGVNGTYGNDEEWQARRWREPPYGPSYRSYGSGSAPYQSEYWSERPRYEPERDERYGNERFGTERYGRRDVWEDTKREAREGWERIKSTFAGKGPKGYTRSDERIKEDVCEKLYWHPEVDASDIEVSVKGGDVMLAGKVPDRRSKRLAEDLADSVTGVKDVSNGLRVDRGIYSETVSTPRSGNGNRTGHSRNAR